MEIFTLTLVICFFLLAIFLAHWVGAVRRGRYSLRSFDGERDKISGNDAGCGVVPEETKCQKFCDNDNDCGEGTEMNESAHQLDNREDG